MLVLRYSLDCFWGLADKCELSFPACNVRRRIFECC